MACLRAGLSGKRFAAATLLPLGVKALAISTIGLTSSGSSMVVAATGPLVNLLLSLTLALASASALPSVWRFFGWLFGTVNLFNATVYLLYSSILGTGDWATVFDGMASPSLWRPIVGLLGLAAYAASVYLSLAALRRLCASGVLAAANVERTCMGIYWTGGLVLTAGSVFNPVSPWYILTSGAANGFGAMVGLVLLPPLLRRSRSTLEPMGESLRIGRPWVVAGLLAAVVFVAVFGPGVRLAS